MRGHQRTLGSRLQLLLLLCFGGAASLCARGERFHGHREQHPHRRKRDESYRKPQEAVIQKHSGCHVRRPRKRQHVFLRHRPVARDVVEQQQSNGVKDSGPEPFQRTRGAEHRYPDYIKHEQSHTLQINHKNLARKRRHCKKKRTQEKDLYYYDRKERLQIPPRMIRPNSQMIRPRSESAEESPKYQAGKRKDGGYERTCPTSAEVGKFRYRFREKDLIGVALEVAQDGRAEYRGDDDQSEKSREPIIGGDGKRSVQQYFSVIVSDRSEIFRGHGEEAEGEPHQEVNVRGQALAPKLQLEFEKFPEQVHCRVSPILILRLPRKIQKVNVLKVGIHLMEAFAGIRVGVHPNLVLAAYQVRGNYAHLRFEGAQLVITCDDSAPDFSFQRLEGLRRRAFQQHFARSDDRHLGAKFANVIHDVRGEDHRHVTSDGAEQIEKAVRLGGVQFRCGLVHNDQPRICEQRLGDPIPLLHAA